jgi:hypothetical protein
MNPPVIIQKIYNAIIMKTGECSDPLARKAKHDKIVRTTDKIVLFFRIVLLYGRKSLVII